MSSPRPLAKDPFPSIPCALLNAHDIEQYASYGGPGCRLFQPFEPGNLKSASYEIPFLGSSYRWEASKSGRQDKTLQKGDRLLIPQNGIVFVSPEVKLHIPDYLALRFNLHIRLVHRGLLLGTGPLVDPGFEGHLLIPIHNLTDSDVEVEAKDGFIWIEVTKVSTLPLSGIGFPENKKNVEPWTYFNKANGGGPIRSSMHSISDELKESQDRLKEYETRSRIASLIAIVTVVTGLFATCFATWSLWRDMREYVGTSPPASVKHIEDLSAQVAALEREMATLKVARTNSASSPSNAR